MKKLYVLCCFFLFLISFMPNSPTCNAEEILIYQIYDENEMPLTQREDVEVGDKFIDRNFNEYEIYLVDKTNQTAKARYNKTYEKPKITKNSDVEPISSKPKRIALYMTHNDESYIIGDGTESVYGAGGIHDIAKTIKSELEKCGVQVVLDETLHIPHNSSAYSRSNATAKNLLTKSPDAIFDIHRDGTSRNYYVTNVNGQEKSKIRIVLGQSNPNSAENLKFAMYLMSVADVECPWLFHDIYWGKGHYNQALSNKALLFEMGTHTIEKEYVKDAAKQLAKVINATLYKTTVDNGDLTIGESNTQNKPTVNESLEESSSNLTIILVCVAAGVVLITIAITYEIITNKKKKR